MSEWGVIDLHAHSSASDGTESPAELVRQAAAAGIGTVAITDHDTTRGWDEAIQTARETGIRLIPGVEFSSQLHGASVHVLGYLLDSESQVLFEAREQIRADRIRRAERMVAAIGADYPLTWDDVIAHSAPDATIGRPHIADALVTAGVVPDRSAAFAGVLHWRGGYYQPQQAPPPHTAVRLIREAGGVPVIAHPAARGMATMHHEVLSELVDAGLFGLEIDHRDNAEQDRVWLRDAARNLGLVTTGSSDWHGTGKPNQFGEHSTSQEALEAIIAQATGSAAIIP